MVEEEFYRDLVARELSLNGQIQGILRIVYLKSFSDPLSLACLFHGLSKPDETSSFGGNSRRKVQRMEKSEFELTDNIRCPGNFFLSHRHFQKSI